MKVKLRDYQEDAIQLIKQAIKKSKKIVAVLPCRAGKTILIGYICQKLIENGKTATILVHRQELFDQTIEKLS